MWKAPPSKVEHKHEYKPGATSEAEFQDQNLPSSNDPQVPSSEIEIEMVSAEAELLGVTNMGAISKKSSSSSHSDQRVASLFQPGHGTTDLASRDYLTGPSSASEGEGGLAHDFEIPGHEMSSDLLPLASSPESSQPLSWKMKPAHFLRKLKCCRTHSMISKWSQKLFKMAQEG